MASAPIALGTRAALRGDMPQRTTGFDTIPSDELCSIVGGEDSVAGEVASHARRAAEDRVTPRCIERFATPSGSQQQALDCIRGAGDQAFNRTLQQLSGVPVTR